MEGVNVDSATGGEMSPRLKIPGDAIVYRDGVRCLSLDQQFLLVLL